MKHLLLVAVCGLVLVLVSCGGQRGEELYTIGVFQFSSNAPTDRTIEGFLQAMEDAGYKDGENVRYQFENALADIPTTQLIAKQLNRPDVDLIFVASTPALQAVLAEVEEKPVVFGAIANPYILGAGQSAEEHLPHVTGASATAPMRQAMELMLEALPDAKRVGILWDPANANSHWNMEVTQEAAGDLGVEIMDVTISASSEVLQAAQLLATRGIDAFFLVPDHIVMDSFDSLAKTADQARIPLIAPVVGLAEQGAAIAIGWDYFDNGYLSGQLVVRVMKGESPVDIPFQGLSKTLTYINLEAADVQGLSIPQSVLQRADKVIGQQ
jgi:putative ABC transport system substrate-binding protein